MSSRLSETLRLSGLYSVFPGLFTALAGLPLLLIVAFLLLLLAACSVLEDRMNCPCELIVDLSKVRAEQFPSLAIVVSGKGGSEGYFSQTQVDSSEYAAGVKILVSLREEVNVVVYGLEDTPLRPEQFLSEGEFVVPWGYDSPAVYMCAQNCDCSTEQTTCGVQLQKNYCRIDLHFVSDSKADYLINLSSQYCGYSREGKPALGTFLKRLIFDDEGYAWAMVTRQEEASLVLDIITSDGLLRHYALGLLLEQNGYDWQSPQLKDVSITIDYTSNHMIIATNLWTKEIFLPVVV